MCTDKICRDSSHDQHLKYVPYFQPCGSDLAMKSTEKKTDTLFPGNNMTAAGLEPPIFLQQ